MENSKLYNLTLEKLKSLPFAKESVDNDLIIIPPGNNHESVDFLKFPCRLDAFALIIGSTGEATATINLHEIKVTHGTIVANIPSNIFQINEMSDNFSCYSIIASKRFIDDSQVDIRNMSSVFLHVQENLAMVLQGDEFNFLKTLFNLLHETIKAKDSIFKRDTLNGLASATFHKICDVINNNIPNKNNSDSRKKNRHEIIFHNFMELLNQYHKKQHGVGFYADLLYITPKYLSTIIKNISGKSAAEWIDDYVILEAKNLLKFSDMSIQQISYDLNFSSPSFFGRFFRNHTGMTPLEFRRN